MTKSIKELCRPVINFDVELIRFSEDTQILHFDIKEGIKKPYFAFLEKHHRFGKAFVRVNDRSYATRHYAHFMIQPYSKPTILLP
ncbi:RNA-binding domain-containing protein [Anaplasma marginale]|uniref:RNA-binding domain-containing protein n=1 Tax=Anaplasma marginale TaxID=770 RepID=UPI0034E021E6